MIISPHMINLSAAFCIFFNLISFPLRFQAQCCCGRILGPEMRPDHAAMPRTLVSGPIHFRLAFFFF